jgi:hypothetical protein
MYYSFNICPISQSSVISTKIHELQCVNFSLISKDYVNFRLEGLFKNDR